MTALAPWIVSTTTQQAVSNRAYLVTSPTLATLTLPAAPTIGDSLKVTSPGAGGFSIIANAGQSISGGNGQPTV